MAKVERYRFTLPEETVRALGVFDADSRHVFGRLPVAVTKDEILDVRGMRGFTAILDATGAGTYRPCLESGGIPPGAPAAAALVTHTLVDAIWPFYLLTRSAGSVMVAVV